ncbi:MAG: nucleoside phosphorylase [Oscillospiraceae bacterium]|nr:nucleoside phosphorylase [Oscillospiraceae bacterium]
MIVDSYDMESEPILNLESVYGPKNYLTERCLILFSEKIYEYVLSHYECRQIAEVIACNGNIPIWAFQRNGQEIAFYLTPVGSALAGSMTAEVNHLTGASKFIMFGSCGSLDQRITNGKFIIPSQAYRGEGMSYYFAAPQDYITIKNADRLEQIFTQLHLPFVKGKVWTTDCPLRETVNLVNKRKQEGCIAVEMEVAGVQAVCDFYGFELYDFLAAGDVLEEGNYQVEKLSDANHNLDKLQIALRILDRV